MHTKTLDHQEWHIIRCALEIAAAQYVQDATVARAAGIKPVEDAFMHQNQRARAVLHKLTDTE